MAHDIFVIVRKILYDHMVGIVGTNASRTTKLILFHRILSNYTLVLS